MTRQPQQQHQEEAAAIRARLEARFEEIARTRMEGVPILNPALGVEALGFEPLEEGGGDRLGVLITPWFLNLVILPAGAHEGWATGHKLRRRLPAGEVEFIVTLDEELGPLLMCSLFSPVFEFADRQAAHDTAASALAEVMNPDCEGEGDRERRALEECRPIPFMEEFDHEAAAAEEAAERAAAEAAPEAAERTAAGGAEGADAAASAEAAAAAAAPRAGPLAAQGGESVPASDPARAAEVRVAPRPPIGQERSPEAMLGRRDLLRGRPRGRRSAS